jgi:hypothetical protein
LEAFAMSLGPRPAASAADLAAIELRRIIDVLQVEHASLFVHDEDHPQRAAAVAAAGIPVDEALAEYGGVVARVMHTGRVHEVAHPHGSARGACSAMAVPLLDGERPIGVLLVVTVRDSRRLGTFDAQVIVRATETLVSRIASPERRFERHSEPDRFVRAVPDPLR